MNHKPDRFDTRAAERFANIIVAELSSVGADVFPVTQMLEDGTVIAQSRSGALYHLQWCVTHQRIETISTLPAMQVQTIELGVAA